MHNVSFAKEQDVHNENFAKEQYVYDASSAKRQDEQHANPVIAILVVGNLDRNNQSKKSREAKQKFCGITGLIKTRLD